MSDQIFGFTRVDLSKASNNKFVVITSELSEDMQSFMEDFQEALPELLNAGEIVDYENAESIYDALTQYCEDNGMMTESEDEDGEETTDLPVFLTNVTRIDFGADFRVLIYLVGQDLEEDEDSEEDWDGEDE